MTDRLQQLRGVPRAAIQAACEIVYNADGTSTYEGLGTGDRHELVNRIAVALAPQPGAPSYSKLYRWAYALLTDLAKVELEVVRKQSGPDVWPMDMRWEGLGATSRSSMMRRVRERLGIDHDHFLVPVRSGQVEVEDIYDGEPLDAEPSPVLDGLVLVAHLEWAGPEHRCLRCGESRPIPGPTPFPPKHGGHAPSCDLWAWLERVRGR